MSSISLKAVFLLFILPFLFPGRAWASFALTGLADLEYTKFEETSEGKNMSVAQFQQRYELGANAGGDILGKGFGDYALSIRYQYMDSEANFNSEEVGAGDHKLMGDAQLNLHPADLPWKLRVYHSDSNPLFPVSNRVPGSISSLSPLVVADIEDGGIRTYGFSFEYDGSKVQESEDEMLQYLQVLKERKKKALSNEELRQMYLRDKELSQFRPQKPATKLYIDYRTIETNRSDNKERTEELKSSLNQGKNWLNYDSKRYENLLGGGDYTEDGLQIGNVNRYGNREWFYLSNWTLLSVDASFRRMDNQDIPRAIDAYNLNLFANAFRSTWEAYLYGTYSQTLNNEAYAGEYQLSLPLYLASKPAPDVAINNKLSYRQWEKWKMDIPRDPWQGQYFQGTPQELEDWVAGKPIPGETLEKKQEVVEDFALTHLNLPAKDMSFKPRFSMTQVSGMGDGDYTQSTISYSLESNPARSYSYGLNYTFNSIHDEDKEDISDNFTSHTFSINGRYAVTQRIGVTGTYTSGQAQDEDRMPTPDYHSDNIDIAANLYLHRTLSMDLRGSRKYTKNLGDGYEEARTYKGNIRFTPASWMRITSSNTWVNGEREGITSEKSVNNPSVSIVTSTNNRSSHTTSNLLEIRVNRSLSSRTRFDYSQEEERGRQETVTTVSWPDEPPQTYTYSTQRRGRTVTRTVEEGFEYVRLTSGYRVRTLFSLTGSANYSETKTDTSYTNTKGTSLGFNYYPFQHMSLGLNGRYNVGSDGSIIKGGDAYIAFPFPQLNISASYSYENSNGMNDYTAHKVTLKLRKVF